MPRFRKHFGVEASRSDTCGHKVPFPRRPLGNRSGSNRFRGDRRRSAGGIEPVVIRSVFEAMEVRLDYSLAENAVLMSTNCQSSREAVETAKTPQHSA